MCDKNNRKSEGDILIDMLERKTFESMGLMPRRKDKYDKYIEVIRAFRTIGEWQRRQKMLNSLKWF